MRGIWKMTFMEIKLFMREPIAAFFTLVFPLMMLFLFGSIFSNRPDTFLGGVGFINTAVPAFTAMIIATSGLVSLTIHIASYREKLILRRLRATPLRPQAILFSQVVMIFLMTVLGMALLIIAGVTFYDLNLPGNIPNLVLAFTLSCLSFFVLGFVIVGFLSTTRTTMVVCMAIFYPMLFLSGATIPLEVLPPVIRDYNIVLPLTHVVTLLRGLWIGESLAAHLLEIIFLSAMLIVGVAISAKTFRWD